MPSSNEHIAARDDVDLQKRLIAIAEILGYENANIAARFGQVVGKKIEVYGSETTIADVYANAAAVRAQHLAEPAALPPGLNPTAVTDEILTTAVQAILGPVTPPAQPQS
ncbi:hypothetical protein SEA_VALENTINIPUFF_73 [Microbacterium phage ValentiniPuff]|uniref:Uncharacterized protein n=1 Tax=Microbacterium phage ValentiniPuff TaxID=2315705 RepID=A0A386KP41_9CAUD|nr:hypothetical protein SEA_VALENTINIPUFF_73 [Microbacterium phage ValentiniPuff]